MKLLRGISERKIRLLGIFCNLNLQNGLWAMDFFFIKKGVA